ncbi:MAG: polysaccharide deacetylase family protein [Coriobacteriia bacterium]|nr:polysaccharide deacetylase family protein [Coriobacteriia bacterium]
MRRPQRTQQNYSQTQSNRYGQARRSSAKPGTRQRPSNSRAAHPRSGAMRATSRQKLNAYSDYQARHKTKSISRRAFTKAGMIVPFLFLVGAGGGGFYLWSNRSVNVEIDGVVQKVPINSGVKDLLQAGLIKAQNGNLISVSGSVLKQGEGQGFTVTINGHDLGNSYDQIALQEGDKISFSNGKDIEEEHDSDRQDMPYYWKKTGNYGAVGYISNWGSPGYSEKVLGHVSHEAIDRGVVQEPVDREINYINVEPKNGKKLVAITFDDGPSKYSLPIADILDKHGAKGTFFEIGKNVKEMLQIDAELVNRGHQVAIHTMNHPNLPKISPEEQIKEIVQVQELFKQIGLETSCFRAPYGAFQNNNWETLAKYISSEVRWNHDSLDWKKPGPSTIVKNSTGNYVPGSIILCHAGGGAREQTIEALPQILRAWQDRGFKFVTVDELIASDERFPERVAQNRVDAPDVPDPEGFAQA